jgi:hypothetical protein
MLDREPLLSDGASFLLQPISADVDRMEEPDAKYLSHMEVKIVSFKVIALTAECKELKLP